MLCKICNKEYAGLGSHLKYSHNIKDVKKYYDEYENDGSEGICLQCGKPTTFRGLTKGYLRFCSYECCNSSKDVVKKKKESTKLKHGSENFRNIEKSTTTRLSLYGQFNSKECIEKITASKRGKTVEELRIANEKSKETRLAKYNAWRSEESADKIAQTKLERYGSSSFNNRDKAKNTIIERYNVTHQGKLFLLRHVQDNNTVVIVNDKGQTVDVKCKCCASVSEVTRSNLFSRKDETLCPICLPYIEKCSQRSIEEQEVVEFIKSIYTGNILTNTRKTLSNNLELDIYLPEKNLAFEFDGLYWHSTEFREPKYHLQKTKECEKQGIQLIHIFEDEWLFKRDIVKSRIKGLLGINQKIFARKCYVKQIESKIMNEFLEHNHIQGACSSKYNYGLLHNGELVSVMSFGKSRFKENEFELLRFSNKLDTNVIGGASKLFKHFLNDHKEIQNVISYADRRWSKGNLYEKLNFVKEKETPPNYFYVKQQKRLNRMNFQKHKLVADGADSSKTEHEIMEELGYGRIYDCGNLKYMYNRT